MDRPENPNDTQENGQVEQAPDTTSDEQSTPSEASSDTTDTATGTSSEQASGESDKPTTPLPTYSVPMTEKVAAHMYGKPGVPIVPSDSVNKEAPAISVAMPNTPGLIVLQWLTYAFWGWTILGLIWLAWIVLANFILGIDVTSVIPYAIASILVLLPLSFTLDAFYGRKETTKKTGAATIVMVIHAVIFALCGIGVLISGVFTIVQTVVGSSSKFSDVMLYTLLISAAVYGLTFFRTLNPSPKIPIARTYKFIMAGIIGLLIVLAFVGPVAKSIITKDDREIASNVGYVASAISGYVESNQKLPGSLKDVTLKNGAKSIVDKNLVRYKAEGPAPTSAEDVYNSSSYYKSTTYRYQLCVTYTQADEPDSTFGDSYYSERSTYEYASYLSVSSHPAGEVCYKLQATARTPVTDSGAEMQEPAARSNTGTSSKSLKS